MSGDRMGDEVYQPENEEQADAAPLDLEDALGERDYDAMLDEGYSPPEKPLGANDPGVTAAAQREGESLEQRLEREEPEVAVDGSGGSDSVGDLPGGQGELVDDEVGAERAGRLVAPDEGAHPDTVREPTAADVGIDGGAASAEEAAMHVVPEEEYGE